MELKPPVILVDDNHDDLFILKRLLTRAGIKNPFISFDYAEEAKRFLEAALRTPEANLIPAAIFSDKSMPDLNGFELLAWVRAQPKLKRVHVTIVTSVAEPGDDERARQLGADRFFEKFPPQHVFSEIFGTAVLGG